jgi:hypothetical protein
LRETLLKAKRMVHLSAEGLDAEGLDAEGLDPEGLDWEKAEANQLATRLPLPTEPGHRHATAPQKPG